MAFKRWTSVSCSEAGSVAAWSAVIAVLDIIIMGDDLIAVGCGAVRRPKDVRL
jgi:hypothetical protein